MRTHISDTARLARLKAALQRGESFRAFARAEGITVQTLMYWINSRPAYAHQVDRYRRGYKSAPVTGAQFQARVEAVRTKLAGACWKVAAAPLGIEHTALSQWYRINRAAVDSALAQRRAA
jgi:hypothetical protein